MTAAIDKFFLNVVLLNSKKLVAAKAQEKEGKHLFGRIAAKALTGNIEPFIFVTISMLRKTY